MIYGEELLRKGGEWLGEARAWLQRHKLNGSRVTWGSQDELQPPMTVRDVEEVAAYAAAAERNRAILFVEKSEEISDKAKARLLDFLGKI